MAWSIKAVEVDVPLCKTYRRDGATEAWRNRTNGALHFHSALHAQGSHGMYAAPHNTVVSHQGLIMYLELSATLVPQASN